MRKPVCFLHMRKQRRIYRLRDYRAAEQRLCFHYIESTLHLLSKSEVSSMWPSAVALYSPVCVGNPEERFFQYAAEMTYGMILLQNLFIVLFKIVLSSQQ